MFKKFFTSVLFLLFALSGFSEIRHGSFIRTNSDNFQSFYFIPCALILSQPIKKHRPITVYSLLGQFQLSPNALAKLYFGNKTLFLSKYRSPTS